MLCVPFVQPGICLTPGFSINRKKVVHPNIIEKLYLYSLTGQVFSQQKVLHSCPDVPWSAAPCGTLCPLFSVFIIFFICAKD